MEYLIFAFSMAGFVLVVFLKGHFQKKKDRAALRIRLREEYGNYPTKEYGDGEMKRIAAYHREHGQNLSAQEIDDITWNDLNMDSIFASINHTRSYAGEEYLYHCLRSPFLDAGQLEAQEKKAAFFAEHEKEREEVAFLMHELGGTGKYSLFDYLNYLKNLGKRSNGKHYLLLAAYLCSVGMLIRETQVGIIGLLGCLIYGILSYFREKKEIEPYTTSFAYIIRMIQTSESMTGIEIPVCAEEWETIRHNRGLVKQLGSSMFSVLTGTGAALSGNPLEMLMDYIRMAFHVDLIIFNRMVACVQANIPAIERLVTAVGKVDTAIAIASWRASLTKGWCRPEWKEAGELCVEEIYHPLIEEPVKNSIVSGRGALITGSNASGKSTFLKTMAINAILAQTVNTVAADRYEAPFYRICTSMSLRDSLQLQESYYMAEIRALKRILTMAEDETTPILCCVDEVLRGTNTLERIAASTQILKSLADRHVICFAATHDIELAGLLDREYDNYHFEEEIRDGDMTFPYKLIAGESKTRNAIRLLELMGYSQEITQAAMHQAAVFAEKGRWEG